MKRIQRRFLYCRFDMPRFLFPRKETGVSTQGNNSAHVRKRQYPRKETGVPPLETPVLKGGNNSTEGRKPARAQEEE